MRDYAGRAGTRHLSALVLLTTLLTCPFLSAAQKHLVEVSEAIASRLEYFRELEVATRMLNLPGETLVLQDDFLNMLDRLDVCLEYLKGNVSSLVRRSIC